MDRNRAIDWLIGALGMLVILGVAVVILWFAVSKPAGESDAEPSPTPSVTSESASPDAEPPAGLGPDDVWLADIALDAGTVVADGSTLQDVQAVGRDVVTVQDGLIAGELTVDATIPFDVIASELGGGSVVSAADDGQARVVRTVEFLGRELEVTATGAVEVQGGLLVVEPRSIDFGGPDFLSDATAAVVRQFVTIEHAIEGLPEGLVLQNVSVQDDGFRANLRGENVRLVE